MQANPKPARRRTIPDRDGESMDLIIIGLLGGLILGSSKDVNFAGPDPYRAGPGTFA